MNGRHGVPWSGVSYAAPPRRHTSALKNRAYLDFLVEDVAAAVAQVIGLGGRVLRAPGWFFEPGASDPVLEWAVLADPFGNEFCLIREL